MYVCREVQSGQNCKKKRATDRDRDFSLSWRYSISHIVSSINMVYTKAQEVPQVFEDYLIAQVVYFETASCSDKNPSFKDKVTDL